jgi:hypothetical protein
MQKIFDLIKAEPVLFQGAFQAALAMGMSFGLGLTADQIGAIMAFTTAALTFVTRSQVTPNHIVAQKVEVALNTPSPMHGPGSPLEQLKEEKPNG